MLTKRSCFLVILITFSCVLKASISNSLALVSLSTRSSCSLSCFLLISFRSRAFCRDDRLSPSTRTDTQSYSERRGSGKSIPLDVKAVSHSHCIHFAHFPQNYGGILKDSNTRMHAVSCMHAQSEMLNFQCVINAQPDLRTRIFVSAPNAEA